MFKYIPFLVILLGLICALAGCRESPKPPDCYAYIPASDTHFQYIGRFYTSRREPEKAKFAWSGASIIASFTGTSCTLLLNNRSSGKDDYGKPFSSYYNIFLDSLPPFVLEANLEKGIYPLFDSLVNTVHTIKIFKRTEAHTGIGSFEGLMLDEGADLVEPPERPKRRIEFIGNSITCGYGNEGDSKKCKFSAQTENHYWSYAAIAARELDAEFHTICYSGIGISQNYDEGLDGTMPAMYSRVFPNNERPKWRFSKWRPQAVVINLGTNDFAHKNPDKEVFKGAYIGLLTQIRSHYPYAHIFCLTGPMQSDAYPADRKVLSTLQSHLKEIHEIMQEMGDKRIHLFDLSTQGKLGYGCDWHPNVGQHQKNADELVKEMRRVLGWTETE